MPPYHLRRSEKEIKDEHKLLRIIQGQQFMTLAMCHNNEPYLVTLNYGFDAEQKCFYFHCAHEGKKRDYLARNPTVWGQILEDYGYVVTECEHAFRTVQFRGQVTFLETEEDKRMALELMIDQLEPDPEPVKERLTRNKKLDRVSVGKVQIQTMTGKESKVEEWS